MATKRYRDVFTDDMFMVPQAPAATPASMNYAGEVSLLAASMFADSRRSRFQIADDMTLLTGIDVSKYMLDAWSAESRVAYMLSAAGAVDTFTRNLSGATDQQIKLANAIDDTRLAQQRLDAAQGNNGGVSSIDGGTDRNGSVGSTSQTMQKGRSLSAVDMTRQKAQDIKQGLNVGDFTEEDLANARAALFAANANSRMFASLPPSAVSIDGMQGVQADLSRSQDLVATIQGALNRKKQDPALRPPGNAGGGPSGLGEQLLAQLNQTRSSGSLSLPSSAVQSIASQAPSKVIQVNFTNNKGTSIPVTVDADNETALLDLLHQAKGVSA